VRSEISELTGLSLSFSFFVAAGRGMGSSHTMAAEYTPRQGQFLAFIYYDTKLNGVPPAESDMQRYFRVSAPAVHEMVMMLERRGVITREPGKPRSIRLLLTRAELPDLE
jgi:SOS-response transcriptional repressor LexA